MASLLPKKLNAYLESLERSNHPVLRKMEAEASKRGFPIIGPQCGRRMAVLASAIGARRVFEMGSGFGYSTVWFAAAVGPQGEVVHTEFDPENSRAAATFLKEAGLSKRCRFEVGDAVSALKKESGPFDCFLIDIDKHAYPEALRVAVPKLRVGGLIFAHNTLWSGRVAEPGGNPQTRGIKEFNKAVMAHPELMSYIDPADDGLAVCLKVTRGQKNRFKL